MTGFLARLAIFLAGGLSLALWLQGGAWLALSVLFVAVPVVLDGRDQ